MTRTDARSEATDALKTVTGSARSAGIAVTDNAKAAASSAGEALSTAAGAVSGATQTAAGAVSGAVDAVGAGVEALAARGRRARKIAKAEAESRRKQARKQTRKARRRGSRALADVRTQAADRASLATALVRRDEPTTSKKRIVVRVVFLAGAAAGVAQYARTKYFSAPQPSAQPWAPPTEPATLMVAEPVFDTAPAASAGPESQTDESQTDESQTAESQTEGSQTEGSQPDETQTEGPDAQTEGHPS